MKTEQLLNPLELTDEQLSGLSKAECVCYGLALLLQRAEGQSGKVEVCSHHDRFLALPASPLSDDDYLLMEKLRWTDSPEGGYEIFT